VLIIIFAGALAAYGYKHWQNRSLTTVTGRAWVVDGDTIDVSGRRIRLQGIDAPELDQTCTDAQGQPWPCGRAAARELGAHINSQHVTCESSRLDRYERALATCRLPDGSDVNVWMVREGWALDYGRAHLYGAEEAQARTAKRGIWAGSFTRPWEWRQQHSR
jgi:endonuclease YncB( thermonuclease family)